MRRIIASASLFLIAAIFLTSFSSHHGDMLTASAQPATRADPATPLPLAVPYRTLMTGIVGESAFKLFWLEAKAVPLNADDWSNAGQAALNLSAMATLLSLEGTNASDIQNYRKPLWGDMVRSLHAASAQVEKAVLRQDETAFNRAVVALANTCQTCHEGCLTPTTDAGKEIANEAQHGTEMSDVLGLARSLSAER